MGQALYRKYRSKSLSEIVGQEHIITTLRNSLKQGNISHAYLFTGPRGVGKTSIARILAHEINELPYDEANPDIDIIEIDAASNRRIDEIRDLRDKVHIAPTSAKYKVYIIDEVHMLTKEAFNALLKTLEEPPAHVIFILATTEAHKLPETIISRTQRFNFRAIDPAKAVSHLKTIAKQEGLSISDEALEVIAEHGDGSFRDSISLLDQVSSAGKNIEADDIRDMLGIAPTATIDALYQSTLGGTPSDIVRVLDNTVESGLEPSLLAKQLARVVRTQLLNGTDDPALLAQLLDRLIEVPASSDPAAKLEVVLLGINLLRGQAGRQVVEKPAEPAPTTPKKSAVTPPKAAPATKNPTVSQPVEVTEDFAKAWHQTLQAIKKQYNTLYGVLRMATPEYVAPKVTLHFQFPFHQKRVNEAKNRQIVVDVLSAHLGQPISISCVANGTAPEPKHSTPPKDSPLDTISNIFGSTEVLES